MNKLNRPTQKFIAVAMLAGLEACSSMRMWQKDISTEIEDQAKLMLGSTGITAGLAKAGRVNYESCKEAIGFDASAFNQKIKDSFAKSVEKEVEQGVETVEGKTTRLAFMEKITSRIAENTDGTVSVCKAKFEL